MLQIPYVGEEYSEENIKEMLVSLSQLGTKRLYSPVSALLRINWELWPMMQKQKRFFRYFNENCQPVFMELVMSLHPL